MKKLFSIDINKLKPILFYALLFSLCFGASFIFNELDYDLWARLINGQHVYYTGLPLYKDIVSYTSTNIWHDPEWLSSLLIYIVQKKFSIGGLTLLKAFSCFTILVVVQLAVSERNKTIPVYNLGFFIILLLILIQTSVIRNTVRCQLVTFIFLAVWILFLEKIRNGKNKYLYFLPFIMLIWLNSHGGSVAGVGVLFLYGIGEFLNKKPCIRYFVALFFVCLVYFINPWGADFISFILKSSVIDRSWIAEWQSSFVHFYNLLFYKLFMIVGFICYIFRHLYLKIKWIQIDKVKLLLITIISLLSIKYAKHIGLFVSVFPIFLYEDLYYTYDFLMDKLRQVLCINKEYILILKKVKDIILYSIIYVFACYSMLAFPVSYTVFKNYIETYPVIPLEFLKVNSIKGKILVSFSDGSYIAYKGYPDLKIYMDGREEQLYSMELFDELMFFLTVSGDYPQILLKKNPPDVILIPKNFRASIVLDISKNYSKIYDDSKYVIYIKNEQKKLYYFQPKIQKTELIKSIFDTKIDFRKSL